jgi:hypothetical protein
VDIWSSHLNLSRIQLRVREEDRLFVS